jgi:hypothetical protein
MMTLRVRVTVVGVAEVLFVVVFLGLVYSNLHLRNEVSLLERAVLEAHRLASSRSYQLGDRFEALPVVAKDGIQRLLDPAQFHEDKEIVIVVDPSCPSCETVLEEVVRARSVRDGFAPWIISTGSRESVGSSWALEELAGMVFVLPEETTLALRNRLSWVPQVLVVSRSGRVVKACSTLHSCEAETSIASPGIARGGSEGWSDRTQAGKGEAASGL